MATTLALTILNYQRFDNIAQRFINAHINKGLLQQDADLLNQQENGVLILTKNVMPKA